MNFNWCLNYELCESELCMDIRKLITSYYDNNVLTIFVEFKQMICIEKKIFAIINIIKPFSSFNYISSSLQNIS